MASVSMFRVVLVSNGRSRHEDMQIASDKGAHVEVGVMTSTALLVLDLRESAAAPIELALVLGTLLLCGDCPSPVRSGGVGTAEADVSIGGGARLFNRCCACGGGGGGTVV